MAYTNEGLAKELPEIPPEAKSLPLLPKTAGNTYTFNKSLPSLPQSEKNNSILDKKPLPNLPLVKDRKDFRHRPIKNLSKRQKRISLVPNILKSTAIIFAEKKTLTGKHDFFTWYKYIDRLMMNNDPSIQIYFDGISKFDEDGYNTETNRTYSLPESFWQNVMENTIDPALLCGAEKFTIGKRLEIICYAFGVPDSNEEIYDRFQFAINKLLSNDDSMSILKIYHYSSFLFRFCIWGLHYIACAGLFCTSFSTDNIYKEEMIYGENGFLNQMYDSKNFSKTFDQDQKLEDHSGYEKWIPLFEKFVYVNYPNIYKFMRYKSYRMAVDDSEMPELNTSIEKALKETVSDDILKTLEYHNGTTMLAKVLHKYGSAYLTKYGRYNNLSYILQNINKDGHVMTKSRVDKLFSLLSYSTFSKYSDDEIAALIFLSICKHPAYLEQFIYDDNAELSLYAIGQAISLTITSTEETDI
ncbi:hypothetical protein B5S28_g73 [[Candida] boidinii]|nr:hypothetical protein B5S28_g73 [[Candida] boidinii]